MLGQKWGRVKGSFWVFLFLNKEIKIGIPKASFGVAKI